MSQCKDYFCLSTAQCLSKQWTYLVLFGFWRLAGLNFTILNIIKLSEGAYSNKQFIVFALQCETTLHELWEPPVYEVSYLPELFTCRMVCVCGCWSLQSGESWSPLKGEFYLFWNLSGFQIYFYRKKYLDIFCFSWENIYVGREYYQQEITGKTMNK